MPLWFEIERFGRNFPFYREILSFIRNLDCSSRTDLNYHQELFQEGRQRNQEDAFCPYRYTADQQIGE